MSAFITQKGMKVGTDIFRIKDFVYFNFDTLPAQYNQSLEIFKAYFSKSLKLGIADFDGSFVYQKVSEDEILRLPELMAYFSAAINFKIIKDALLTRAGIDVNYFSSYYANSYMPAIRNFYLQNEKKIGNNFHLNVFIDFNVKRTRFFLKAQNILSAFGNHTYYQVPHYPMQDLALKFGLSWRFHD